MKRVATHPPLAPNKRRPESNLDRGEEGPNPRGSTCAEGHGATPGLPPGHISVTLPHIHYS